VKGLLRLNAILRCRSSIIANRAL